MIYFTSLSAVVFGGIVMAGAFAVKYTGTMVLQVRGHDPKINECYVSTAT